MDVITSETKAALEEEGAVVTPQKKKVRRKQYATQLLQMALMADKHNLPNSNLRLRLGQDSEMIQELIDTREKKTEGGYVVYVPRMDSGNRAVDHIVDALRTLVLAAQSAQQRTETDEGEDVSYSEVNLFGKKLERSRVFAI